MYGFLLFGQSTVKLYRTGNLPRMKRAKTIFDGIIKRKSERLR